MSSLEAAVPGGAGSERVVRQNQGLPTPQKHLAKQAPNSDHEKYDS